MNFFSEEPSPTSYDSFVTSNTSSLIGSDAVMTLIIAEIQRKQ
jgi:hypothetical protein